MAKFLTLFAVLLAARYYAPTDRPAEPHAKPSDNAVRVEPSTNRCLGSVSCEKAGNPGKT
jgi:hypothetical protein